MSLAGSCFSSESAPGPLYGVYSVKKFKQDGASFFHPVFFSLPSRASSHVLVRPHLDGLEHDGTAWSRRDDDQRGSPLPGAVQSRHNLVSGRSKDPNHDAVMRIGSEAPKRRTHSSNRLQSQGTCRESATSNRHRPITSVRTGPKLSGCLQRPPFIVPDAKRRRPVQRPAARVATGRSEACAPRPRSWTCENRERSRYELGYHCAKALSFWYMRNRHANWTMPRRTRPLPERANPFSRRFLPLSSGEPVRPA